MRKALWLFFSVAGFSLLVLAVDVRRHRPVQIAPPASADSLAGVIARLFPHVDSSAVGRIRWYRSPDAVLRWADGSDYAYRGETRGFVPVTGQADIRAFSVTLARHESSTFVVKHELGHLLIPRGAVGHDSALFTRLESYGGR